ncbi:MAG: hypothetical protein KDC38_16380, partial [Planctomycetes bacterium]|nr:hypothetical protein [Planctomycetota bacterium]
MLAPRTSPCVARPMSIVALLLAWLPSVPLGAQSDLQYSFILRSTGFANNPELQGLDPNTIFSFDPTTQLAVPASNRLANAINSQIPGALVDAMSYGYGAIDLEVPHGDLHFSVSREPVTGSTGGAPGSDLFVEPWDDCEADLFWVPNVPSLPNTNSVNSKSVDDNTAPGVKKRFEELPSALLGLHGSHGTPSGSAPTTLSNVAAFDHHPPSYADRDIYFSIDHNVGSFGPADILQLDPAGTITLFKPAVDLGLGALDDIDALSIDIAHADKIGQCRVGLYSVTRNSVAMAAADLALFRLDYPGGPTECNVPPQIYRYASANGIAPSDGDIDSIVSIDPRTSWTNKAGATTTTIGSVDAPFGFADSTTFIVDGAPFSTQLGPTLSVTTPNPFEVGDDLVVALIGQKGESIRRGGICRATFDPPVGTGEPIDSDSVSVAVVGSDVEVTWINPAGTSLTETRLDDGAPILGGPTTLVAFVGLSAGVHTVDLRAIDAMGVRSLPTTAVFEIIGSVPMPESLSAEIVGDRLVELTWEVSPSASSLSIALDGLSLAPVAFPIGTTTGAQVVPVGYGYHRFELRAIDPSGAASAPSPVEVFVPLPEPGTVLESAPLPSSDPVAITFVPDVGQLLVLDGSLDQATYVDPTTLSPGATIDGPGSALGGATRGVTVVDPTSSPNTLLWTIDFAPGAGLTTTDTDGLASTFVTDFTAVAQPGDLSHHPNLTGGYVVADRFDDTVHVIDIDGLETFGFAAIDSPAPLGNESAVASRGGVDGFVDLPASFRSATTTTTHIATIDLTGTPITAFALDPIAGHVTAMLNHPTGSRGLPVVYLVTDAGMIYEVATFD